MSLVKRWNDIESGLDPRWSEARLTLAIADERGRNRAVALLAPAGPGRAGATIHLRASRRGAGVGPEAIRRMLGRIDGEGIEGALALVSADAAPAEKAAVRASLAADWDAALALLPGDWSDLLCELELTSSDHLERAALLFSPANPRRSAGRQSFRFRCAHGFGYGASAGMVRRGLERLDEEGIPGTVRVVRAMSDTDPVGTQGHVWHIGGQAV